MIAEMILNYASSKEMLRRAEIQTRWKAYLGRLDKPLKVKPGEPDDNVRLSFCGVAVDKGVSFLFGDDMSFEVDMGKAAPTAKQITDGADVDEDSDEGIVSPEQKWLNDCWEANCKMTTLTKIGLNGGVCGEVFVRVMLPKNALEPFPRLLLVDPQMVRVVTDQDDYEKVNAYILEWNGVDPDTGKAMARRTIIEQDPANNYWSIKDEKSVGNNTTWQLIGIQNWPYIQSPIFHCQNLPMPNEFWGRADLEEDVVEVNTSINFVKSNTNRIIKHHAHPKTWGSGFQARELNTSVDNTIIFNNPMAKLENLEMNSDMNSSAQHYKDLKEAFHEIVQIPEIAMGKMDNVGAVSGTALEIMYKPLAEKTGKKRMLYGDMLKKLCSFLLLLGNKGIDRKVKLTWPNTIPHNILEETTSAVQLETLGVSKDTLLTELGYDAKIEAAKKAKEQQSEAQLGADLLEKYDKGNLTPGNSGGNSGKNKNGGGD